MSFILAGHTLPDPVEFYPRPYRIEYVERTADGTLTADVVAKKLTYAMRWVYMDGPDLEVLRGIYDTSVTALFSYPEFGEIVEKTVWVSALDPGHLVSLLPELYAEVKVELLEV